MTLMPIDKVRWRSAGSYLPTLASKATLLEETRLFLETNAQLGGVSAAGQELINGILLQRSRRTRATIVSIIRMRLVRWNPPSWVLDDLVSFARDTDLQALRVALLLHIARQDKLLYDFAQQVIVPRWHQGTNKIIRSDVQGFLDAAQETHPEIVRWSHTTRERLSNSALTVLRDCGLLKGTVAKYIVLPIVPDPVVHHLIRLLQAEGIAAEDMAHHPDWQLWLWDAARAQKAIDTIMLQERIV